MKNYFSLNLQLQNSKIISDTAMKKFFQNRKKVNTLLAILLAVVFTQSILIASLYARKDDKNYEVNLVQINTQKDSIDYLKMKTDLNVVDHTIGELNSFLKSKNIQSERLMMLDHDSLSNSVYLAKQANRYSQYLVNLQQKLLQVPLGMPTEGYISSNFGVRKNPIPVKMVYASVLPLGNAKTENTEVPTADVKTPDVKENVAKTNAAPAEADQMQFHKGLDIAVAFGSNVIATAAGKVIFSGQKGGYGNCVIVSHGNGLATLYGHLSELIAKTNDEVKVGQVIAKSGNSGRSTGPHLHYEVHKNNNPVNPKLFMNL